MLISLLLHDWILVRHRLSLPVSFYISSNIRGSIVWVIMSALINAYLINLWELSMYIIIVKPPLSTYQISISSLVFPLCLVLSVLSLIISDILDIPHMLTQFLLGLVLLIWKLFKSSTWIFPWKDVFIL